MSETQILFDVGIIIIAATVLGLAARGLRQPMLASYILAGIVIGPSVLGIVENTAVIQMFAELGVAFLLFLVGLELDISRLAAVRNVVVGTTALSVGVAFVAGLGLMLLLGTATVPAVYVGLFVAFNSTAILVKMLSDSGDIDTLHGRIILGILLVQDVLVVLVLSLLSVLDGFTASLFVSALLKGAGLLALAVVLSKYLMPQFFGLIEESQELVFLTALTVLFAFVGVAMESGLSSAVGGFLAGLALTAFPYNIEIAERAQPMRDFFVTIFFVSLGMMVSVGHLAAMLVPLLALLVLVVLVKPVLVNLSASFFGYGKRTAFYTALSLSQVSEFSMVLALEGFNRGHISQEILSMLTAVMVVSLVATSYLLKYQWRVYEAVEEFIIDLGGRFEDEPEEELAGHIVVCGAHIKGRKILQELEDEVEDLAVIEFDPEVVKRLQDRNVAVFYGDVEDRQVLERARVRQAAAVISTVPGGDSNRYLLNYVREENADATVIISADSTETALRMYEEGADYVLYSKMLAAREAADLVRQLYHDGQPLEDARREHIEDLEDAYEAEILKRYEPAFIRQLKDRIHRHGDADD